MKNHLNNCPKCHAHLVISRYECPNCGTSVEGEFSGCNFCRLSDEERLFALIFIQTEGNMKDVERLMGISYPTIKARLSKLNRSLGGEQYDDPPIAEQVAAPKSTTLNNEEKTRILDRLAAGEISASKAARLIRGESDDTDDERSQT